MRSVRLDISGLLSDIFFNKKAVFVTVACLAELTV